MTNADTIEEEIVEAYDDFSKGDVDSIMAGIEVVGKIIEELPQDFSQCEDMQGDITRIENWAKIFEDPTKLVETLAVNIIKNFSKILKDISCETADFDTQNYYQAGSDIADILVLTLGAVPENEQRILKKS